jgi:acetylornithine/succinyldiaminopimelate/putrescine aminotransferase
MEGFVMRTTSRKFRQLAQSDEPPVVYTDDGGSGLLAACQARFGSPDFEVKCDARHTVWVKRADGSRSVGLPPWILRQQSMNEVLERMEEKLGVAIQES